MTSTAQETNPEIAASGAAALTADKAAAVRVLRQFRIVFNTVKSHFRQVERDTGIGGAMCGR